MRKLPLDQVKVNALIKQCKHLNVFPMNLHQYYPQEEPHPIADLMTDLVGESLNYLSIMTDEEVNHLVDSFPPGSRFFIERKGLGDDRDTWRGRIAYYYIVFLLQESYLSYKEIVSPSLDTSEVLKVYPELRKKLDKDGLIHLDNGFMLFDGGIEYKDHILHYHQFLRRGFTSNPNFDFLSAFIRYYRQTHKTNKFRIAIDHQRLMPKDFYRHYFEKDHWFGPRFDRIKLDDRNELGLTVMTRERPSIFDTTNMLDRTEFYWSYQDKVKTFEIEEISSEGQLFGPYYANRYIHSERDISRKVLRHCDGAVKV